MISLKVKDKIDKIFPLLLSALGGKVVLDSGLVIEVFNSKFSFDIEKVGDKVVITFSGNKPRVTATKSILFVSMDFQGRIAKIIIDKSKSIIELDGLPDQQINFV